MMTVETTDIFRSAYLLAQGGELDEIRVTRNGRQRATFRIRGREVARFDRAYLSGQARVNPLQLRECLNHLRDKLFERLRDTEREHERSTHDDRSRQHRRHQTRR